MTKKHLPPPFAPLNGRGAAVQRSSTIVHGYHAPPPSRFAPPVEINTQATIAQSKPVPFLPKEGKPAAIGSSVPAAANLIVHGALQKHRHGISGTVQPAVRPPHQKHTPPSPPDIKQYRAFSATAPVIQKMDIELGYESYEGDSGDELENLGAKAGRSGIRKTNQYKLYDKNRNIVRDMFKQRVGFTPKNSKREKARSTKSVIFSSGMLKSIVFGYESGTPGANTHLLVRKGGNVYLYQANTANGVKLVAGKLMHNKKRVIVRNPSARSIKKKNTHTEMYRLYEETGHDASKVKNILSGQLIVVDKPCCRMCYYWMKEAGAIVRDGTDFSSAAGRDSFAWTDPFTGKMLSKKTISQMLDSQLSDYVKKAIA